ncbi:MAG: hypothetical protein ACRC46_04620 [Thermoguttaceae bacterium]
MKKIVFSVLCCLLTCYLLSFTVLADEGETGVDVAATSASQTSIAEEGQVDHGGGGNGLPIILLILSYVTTIGIAFLIENVFEKPIDAISVGSGNEEDNRLVADKLESFQQIWSQVISNEDYTKVGDKQIAESRQLLKEIAALSPSNPDDVNRFNAFAEGFNGLTRRAFSGWSTLLVVCLVTAGIFITIGFWACEHYAQVVGIGIVFLLPPIAYWRVTRSPIYHLAKNKGQLRRGLSAMATAAMASTIGQIGEFTTTEYRNANTNELVRKESEWTGIGPLVMIIMFVVFAFAIMPCLVLINFVRNYVIRWYT